MSEARQRKKLLHKFRIHSISMNDSCSMSLAMNDSSRSIAIRSLRRRLWRALQQEDVNTAIRAYTATRADYEAWILEEQQVQMAQEKQREHARLGLLESQKRPLQKLGPLRMKRKQSSSKQTSAVTVPHSNLHNDDDDEHLLMKEMDPSNVFVADDFLSPQDPYHDETLGMVNESFKNSANNRRKSKGPRFAGLFLRGSRDDSSEEHEDEQTIQDEFFTTPLHEAARCGSAKLVRLFLVHAGLPNLKNGKQRTALHMAAGGLTAQEENLLIARAAEQLQDKSLFDKTLFEDIGIRAPIVESQESHANESEEHPAAAGAKKAAMAVRRLFTLGNNSDKNEKDETKEEKPIPPLDMKRLNKLNAQRMDTVLAILSWCHPDDGSASACEGPSINSVDARGRTALHYAAELGRADICIAVVSSFGAILTIVDESSRTPCELAGEQSHQELAAQLEARALLYSDPYGVDDELMASILNDEREDGENSDDPNLGRKKLAVPFSWFETLSTVQVRQERNSRVELAMVELQKALVEREEQEKANKVMFSCDVNDSLDSVSQADIAVGIPDEEVNEDSGNDGDDEAVHMLAEIEHDHPPSPRPENADESVDEQMVQEDSELAEKEAPQAGSEYTCLLKSLQESHVERFLSFHNWMLKNATKEFKKDPVKALDDAGVPVKTNESFLTWEEPKQQTCLICFEVFGPDSSKWRNLRGCNHGFCAQCLSDYIVNCARTRGGGITVICPHHECDVPLNQSELQSLVPNPTVYESLLEAADENFVAYSSDLNFCPHPGCEGVVKRWVPPIVTQEGFEEDIVDIAGAVCVAFPEGEEDAPLTYEGVRDMRYLMARGATQPRVAHRFCFACGDETIHWPIPCEMLEQWKTKIRNEIEDIDDEEEGENDGNYQDVAQRLWMKANTRPCPQVCSVRVTSARRCRKC